MWNYWVPNGVLQSRNPELQTHWSRNPEGYFSPSHFPRILLILNLAPILLKIPSPELQLGKSRILESLMESNKLTPNRSHIDALHIYIYLCNGLKVLEISESEYPKYHRSRNIIHESAKIFAFSSIKTQHKLWLVFMIRQLRKGKYFSKIMNVRLGKSEYLSDGKNSLE